MNNHDLKLIIFPLAKWDSPYSSTTFSLAQEFSKCNKVIYIDAPLTLKDMVINVKRPDIRRRISRFLKGDVFQEYNNNLTICYLPPVIPVNFLSQGWLYRSLKSFNEWVIFSYLKKKLRKMNFEKYVYINIFNPFYIHNRYLDALVNIYYTVDNISKSSYIDKHGVWLEKEIIKKSDFSLGTSYELVNNNKKFNPNFYYLPNAADLTVFDPNKSYPKPLELQGIKTKIIIFTGHLDKRNDIQLLCSVLENNRDKTLVIVGLISLKEEVLQQLRDFQNILFVAPKPIAALPAFLYHSDCAIIPFKINELTNSIYPLKINEYLAMGIPVVSTCFSEDIMQFNHVISLTEDPNIFCDLINSEINNDNQERRMERKNAAKNNTWERRVEQFWQITNNHLK